MTILLVHKLRQKKINLTFYNYDTSLTYYISKTIRCDINSIITQIG